MDAPDKSSRIRNYSIAGFFVICGLVVLASAAVFGYFTLKISESIETSPEIWSECEDQSAHIFVRATEDMKAVSCVALDEGFFEKQEYTLGDLSKNDADVCKFKGRTNITEPMRFEIRYNSKVRKEVCNPNEPTQFWD